MDLSNLFVASIAKNLLSVKRERGIFTEKTTKKELLPRIVFLRATTLYKILIGECVVWWNIRVRPLSLLSYADLSILIHTFVVLLIIS